MEINNIVKTNYSFDNILKYSSNDKLNYGSSTWLNFESITDFGDPINNWMPLVY